MGGKKEIKVVMTGLNLWVWKDQLCFQTWALHCILRLAFVFFILLLLFATQGLQQEQQRYKNGENNGEEA